MHQCYELAVRLRVVSIVGTKDADGRGNRLRGYSGSRPAS